MPWLTWSAARLPECLPGLAAAWLRRGPAREKEIMRHCMRLDHAAILVARMHSHASLHPICTAGRTKGRLVTWCDRRFPGTLSQPSSCHGRQRSAGGATRRLPATKQPTNCPHLPPSMQVPSCVPGVRHRRPGCRSGQPAAWGPDATARCQRCAAGPLPNRVQSPTAPTRRPPWCTAAGKARWTPCQGACLPAAARGWAVRALGRLNCPLPGRRHGGGWAGYASMVARLCCQNGEIAVVNSQQGAGRGGASARSSALSAASGPACPCCDVGRWSFYVFVAPLA